MTVSTMYLAQAGLIEKEDIIIDAKSGVSGAGRSAKQNLLYTEIAEGINCYGVGSHRHMPEIEQVISADFHTAMSSVLAASRLKG